MAVLKQDKEVYKALIDGQRKAEQTAKKLPPKNRLRQARYDAAWKNSLLQVSATYSLDLTTALKIAKWGKKNKWPE